MAISKYMQEIIQKRFIKDSKKILDIGGGRNTFPGATHIIDRRSIKEAIGCRENLQKDLIWIQRDFYDMPWDFKDDYFDFSICIGTVEDVKDPISLLKEISRVSKAGVITSPTRALESNPFIDNRSPLENGIIGWSHHRWFVEIINEKLTFTHKTQLIDQHKKYKIWDIRQENLFYFWQGEILMKEISTPTAEMVFKDALRFKQSHKEWLKELNQDKYFYWNKNLGCKPDFSLEIKSKSTTNPLKYNFLLFKDFILFRLKIYFILKSLRDTFLKLLKIK